jgi:lysophospholipase L1-like esterase
VSAPMIVLLVVGNVVGAGSNAARIPRHDYYLSLGDSYAAGYQPVAAAFDHHDTHGFAYQVVGLAKAKGYRFDLRNYGCGGATTRSILREKGCPVAAPGPEDASYPTQTQAAAAERFLSHHRGQVGLVTVSIGGNDVVGCGEAAQPMVCFTAALPALRKNLAVLLRGLRRASGPSVPIVGLTYPDFFLGLDTLKDPTDKADALQSVPEFRDLLNPALRAAYTAVGGEFIDVTAATGAYTPWTDTTRTNHYGIVPVAVAKVCYLTYFCRSRIQDVHPTTPGYAAMARLIVGTLPR